MSVLKFTEPTIDVPVTAEVTEGGKTHKVKFTAVFNRLNRQQYAKIQKGMSDSMMELRNLARELIKLEPDQTDRKNEIDTRIEELNSEFESNIRNHFLRWKNLPGKDGMVEYSEDIHDDVLNEMLAYEPYFNALRDGLMQATGTKREEAKAKN